MSEFHSKMMNLPCVPKWGVNDLTTFEQAYRRGHRDARHAAAELANEADAALSRLRDTQRVLVEALRDCVEALAHLQDRMGVRVNPPTLDRARAALASVEQQPNSDHLTSAADEEVTEPTFREIHEAAQADCRDVLRGKP